MPDPEPQCSEPAASEPPPRMSFGSLLGQLTQTAVGALHNRAELFALEWQEERGRLTELLVWAVGLLFLAVMGIVLLTATIILLVPADYRVYAAAGFTVLYFLGALVAWFGVRALLKHEPFAETLDQVKKDRAWLTSLK